ncbi:MAG: DUF2382 domain-containing protein [Chloroflexi bacterium]|nr:DUF2382 domain-containing protein [Chloroflexota bacterium]
MATFSVATNEYRGGNGERTEYHPCVAWGRLAEICGQFLSLAPKTVGSRSGSERLPRLRCRKMPALTFGGGQNQEARRHIRERKARQPPRKREGTVLMARTKQSTRTNSDSTDLWTYRDSDSWGNVDMTGFDIEATDGSIGTVDEATYDAGKSYVVVDTGPWIFGKKVVLPGGAIQRVDAADRRVWVDLTKTQIENAPEFDELRYRDDDYRTEIGGYYSGHAETDRGYTDTGRGADDKDRVVLERSEERLTVDKHTEQAGNVRVGKRVVAEEQSVDVPVTREEVTITRRAVDRPTTGETLTDASVDVPVYEERVRTGKETRVVEELEVGKTAKTDTERVTDTVRREEFDIDGDDDVRNT